MEAVQLEKNTNKQNHQPWNEQLTACSVFLNSQKKLQAEKTSMQSVFTYF